MARSALVSLLSAASVLVACTGTETGNPPVIDFGNSGCHDQKYAASTLQSVDKSVPDPQYKGLTCMAWQHVDEQTIRIDLTNYESGCGSDFGGWTPRAQLRDDGGLDLIIQDDNCSQAGCGWCMYDLSFTVQLDKPLADGEVRIYQSGCDDAEPYEKRASLALASQPSGAVCNYANRNALGWKGADEGGPRMPCLTTTDSDQQPIACQQGLVCTEVGESLPISAANGGPRCLPSCSTKADCDTLTACDDGVCKLATRGLSSN